jgi:hypothetical protein
MEPRRLEPLYPMLSAANSRFALAPVSQTGAAPAHDVTCMQSKDLSAPAARSAHELEEDAAGRHSDAQDAHLARNWRAVVPSKRQSDTLHIERQSARSTHVRDADRRKLV